VQGEEHPDTLTLMGNLDAMTVPLPSCRGQISKIVEKTQSLDYVALIRRLDCELLQSIGQI
jgi:hypothetical protein